MANMVFTRREAWLAFVIGTYLVLSVLAECDAPLFELFSIRSPTGLVALFFLVAGVARYAFNTGNRRDVQWVMFFFSVLLPVLGMSGWAASINHRQAMEAFDEIKEERTAKAPDEIEPLVIPLEQTLRINMLVGVQLIQELIRNLEGQTETIERIEVFGRGGSETALGVIERVLKEANLGGAELVVVGPCASSCALFASGWGGQRTLGAGGALLFHSGSKYPIVYGLSPVIALGHWRNLERKGVPRRALHEVGNQDHLVAVPRSRARACGFVDACEGEACPTDTGC